MVKKSVEWLFGIVTKVLAIRYKIAAIAFEKTTFLGRANL